MTNEKMSIREEFFKAYSQQSLPLGSNWGHEVALWAAKWMAERCANNVQQHEEAQGYDLECTNIIRQLAKELL